MKDKTPEEKLRDRQTRCQHKGIPVISHNPLFVSNGKVMKRSREKLTQPVICCRDCGTQFWQFSAHEIVEWLQFEGAWGILPKKEFSDVIDETES